MTGLENRPNNIVHLDQIQFSQPEILQVLFLICPILGQGCKVQVLLLLASQTLQEGIIVRLVLDLQGCCFGRVDLGHSGKITSLTCASCTELLYTHIPWVE